MDDLMGQLGFVQLQSDVKLPQIPFDKNPQHGKDADGFDEQLVIVDESGMDKSGISQATMEDPLKSNQLELLNQLLSQKQKKPQSKKTKKSVKRGRR